MHPETNDHVTLEKLTGVLECPRLEAFLKLSDDWTDPALSRRVNLAMFAEKILRSGIVVLAVNASKVDIGMAAFYCNDPIKQRAYLTHLAVVPEYRRAGVGKTLIGYAKNYSTSMGMTSMLLEVYNSNDKAKRFYASCGFFRGENEQANPNVTNSIYMVCSLKG